MGVELAQHTALVLIVGVWRENAKWIFCEAE